MVYNRFCRDGKTDFLRLDFYGLKRGIGMRVRGLQKLTLLDFPGKMGCTVFLGGCNFRCPFCQNSELILPGGDEYEIPEEEFFAFLKKRQGMLDGVCKMCIRDSTDGERTVVEKIVTGHENDREYNRYVTASRALNLARLMLEEKIK